MVKQLSANARCLAIRIVYSCGVGPINNRTQKVSCVCARYTRAYARHPLSRQLSHKLPLLDTYTPSSQRVRVSSTLLLVGLRVEERRENDCSAAGDEHNIREEAHKHR